jgi:hypothetical protein
MDKFTALDRIVTALRRVDGHTSPWDSSYTFSTSITAVYDRELYIDEINSFPCVMCVADQVQVRHSGAGERYNIMTFRIRGVTWDDQVEDAGEMLADDIEHVISHIRQNYPEFDECRINTIQTDEGLNAPLGALIIEGVALYRND